MSYNLNALSPIEFSELIRDLLISKEGGDFSISPEGPDRGMDVIQYGAGNSLTLVAQCKHYAKSSQSILLRDLKKELQKVQQLSPQRYVIACSQSMTSKLKEDLVKFFDPFVKSANDIWGNEDIQSLLLDHPSVVDRHYKLWLGSTHILERFLHRGPETWRTHFRKKIIDRSQVYVQTVDYGRSLEVLSSHRMLVISGSPGVGKSVLAQMLIAKHIENNFDFVEIESFNEELKYIPNEGKVIIYYDDFLGQSVWRDNAPPEFEKRFDNLLDLVQREPRLRLILTTRRYLLESALRFSDSGNRWITRLSEIEIQLSHFSRSIKARILYNHLHFHNVPKDHCKSLTDWPLLRKIIDHPNFIPRLIEWISSSISWPQSMPSAEYGRFILRTLQSPKSIYLHVLDRQISPRAREVLYLLYCHDLHEAETEALRVCFRDFTESNGSSLYTRGDFDSVIKELAGSLIDFAANNSQHEKVRLLNPGVADSLRESLWKNSKDWETLLSLNMSSSRFFNLALAVPGVTTIPLDTPVANFPEKWFDCLVAVTRSESLDADEFLYELSRCIRLNIWEGHECNLEEIIDCLGNRFNENSNEGIDWTLLIRFGLPKKTVDYLAQLDWFQKALGYSVEDAISSHGFLNVRNLRESLVSIGDAGKFGLVILTEAAQEYVDEVIRNSDTNDDDLAILDEYTWDELFSVIRQFDLLNVGDKVRLNKRRKTENILSTKVQNPSLTKQELSEKEILSMFNFLAEG